jgi:hypothetical protein
MSKWKSQNSLNHDIYKVIFILFKLCAKDIDPLLINTAWSREGVFLVTASVELISLYMYSCFTHY